MKTETKFYSIDCDLIKQEQNNYKRFKQEQQTIFYNNQKAKDVILEGVLFAVSFAICSLFCFGIITLITNLIF